MKTLRAIILFLLCAASFGTHPFLNAQEKSQPLWPKGAVPYADNSKDDPQDPYLTPYPGENLENHNGSAILICPGGGYGGLAMDHEGHQIAQWFNDRGSSAFVLTYRLGSQGYHFPTQLADVQRAIRWIRGHAQEYDLSPDRVAIIGFSAGGHLASMAATMHEEKAYDHSDSIDELSARPDFAILCYPVISMFEAHGHRGSRRNLLGPENADEIELAKKVSTDLRVSDTTPPTFLFQTNADSAVPAENCVQFYLSLRKFNIPTEMHIYQDGPHGVGLFGGDPVVGTWSNHLENWLKRHFFFRPAQERISVAGDVSLNGVPVSWGVLSFLPEDPFLPSTAIRIRRGKFSVSAEDGPVAAPSRVQFEGSIWEQTRAPQDRVEKLDRLSPSASGATVIDLSDNPPEKFQFDYRSQ